MHLTFLAPLPLLLAACTTAVPPDTSLPFFGDGYRTSGDACRLLGEALVTQDYLDHTADLVACPADMDGLVSFVRETGAREIFRREGYIAYSVPKA